MNVLTIIGNGFDLGHKLPTTFDEFICSDYDVFMPKYSIFKSGKNTWNEVEQQYSELLLNAMIKRENFDVIDEVDQIIQDYGLNDFGEVDYYNYTADIFSEIYKNIITYISLLKEFEEDFLQYLRKTCNDDKLACILPRKNLKEIFDSSSKIISFNYTNTIENVYKNYNVIHIHGNIDNSIKIGSGTLDDAKTSVVDYRYPTKNDFSNDKDGFVDMLGYYDYDLDGNLVERDFVKRFFNEVSTEILESEEELFELLDEKSKSTLELRKQVVQDLMKARYDLVYIIGHSLGDADKEVLEAINKDARFIYFYHGESDTIDNLKIRKRMQELKWKFEWISNEDLFELI